MPHRIKAFAEIEAELADGHETARQTNVLLDGIQQMVWQLSVGSASPDTEELVEEIKRIGLSFSEIGVKLIAQAAVLAKATRIPT